MGTKREQTDSFLRKCGFYAAFVVFLVMAFLRTEAAVIEAGPLFHEFNLTLDAGERREVMGPFFYEEQVDGRTTFAVPPLFSWVDDPKLAYREFDVLYPVLTYDRFGGESRAQLFQLLSLSDAGEQDRDVRRKFTIFPFYFQQRSTNTTQNYTAVVPFYGTLRNRLFKDEIEFVLFPFYAKTRRKDVVTRNYLYPFFHLREGNELSGWQLWPLVGNEVRGAHTVTNGFGDSVAVPGERISFAAWPFLLRRHGGIGGTNEVRETSVLPLFSLTRSPARDSTAIGWPFFRYTDNREKRFQEWGFPWPLWGIARGEGKHMNRAWPFFSVAYNENIRSEWYLWPFWKRNIADVEGLYRSRTRVLFFLYNDLIERNPVTRDEMHRHDLWPLFVYRKQRDGRERLQALAVLEPLLPNSKSIERNWSPLWSVWRTEKNPATGRRSDSLLWNFWRREISDGERANSWFFGLLQNRKTADGNTWSWFHPLRNSRDEEPEKDNLTDDRAPQPEIGVIPLRPVPFGPSSTGQ